MIKYEIENGRPKMKCAGSEEDLASEVMVLVKMLYDNFCGIHPELGKKFINDLMYCMTIEDSPLYKERPNAEM